MQQYITGFEGAMETLLKGRLSTVDLLVLTTLDQVIFALKYHLPFLQNKLP